MSELVSAAGVDGWRLVDAPNRPSCVPDDAVAVLTTDAGVPFVRTPDERFADLPGYPFAPRYAVVEDLRMHYVDEGPADGETVLLLHGQPTWSYLYRKMIPPLAAAGYRVVAVDHVGMGRSDKPVDIGFHTFEGHVRRLKAFIAALDLHDVSLFCQDWGSLIGLRVAGDQPETFARIVVANGTLPVIPTGLNPFRVPSPVEIDCALGDFARPDDLAAETWQGYFQRWIVYALTAPDFRPSQVVAALATAPISPTELAAYDAPFPSFVYKAAPRAFPSMLAAIEEQNAPAWRALGAFNRPFLFIGGDRDHNMGSLANQRRLTEHVPGAAGQPHARVDAGHFIQEDAGSLLAEKVIAFMRAEPPVPAGPALATTVGAMRDRMHGARYGEVLVVSGHLPHLEASVYSTIGLSDCPEDRWRALDPAAIKREHGARAVVLNGPRYFLMDRVSIANPGREIVRFGTLDMRRLASVRIPLRRLVGGSMRQQPYSEVEVVRDTTYVYDAGREIYRLVDPRGRAYVMQTYSLMVDSSLTASALPALGARLRLPAGWRYEVEILAHELVLTVHGTAYLVQDDLTNSYQRVD